MPLVEILRVSFGFGVIFGEKSQKGKIRKSGIFGFLCRSVGNPHRDRGAKMAPLVTLRRSFATPRCRHSSHKKTFGFLFLKVLYSYTNSLRTLIND